MNKRLKVLHVISQRPDSTGSGIYLQAILNESARCGHHNALIAAIQKGSTVTLPTLNGDDCHLVYFDPDNLSDMIVGMSDVMPYPSRRFQDLDSNEVRLYLRRFREPLSRMVLRHNPDLIHSHHLWLLSGLVKDLFPDIPLITSCHGSDLRQFRQCPRLRKEVRDRCYRIDQVLALSAEQKDEIIDTYRFPGHRIAVAGAGYDKNIFYADKGGRKAGTAAILYAGKISRAKGIPWLLKALSRIAPQRYHLHLVGGGSGTEYENCRAAAAMLGPQVSLHGAVSQQSLAQLMRNSQIFILPSLHEGLPLVVLEALACGCEVITTDLPGTREIKNRLETDRLTLIEKPALLGSEASLPADEEGFVDSLRHSIEKHLSQQRHESDGESTFSYFSWPSVFSRVQQSWFNMGNKKDKSYI